MLLILTYHRAGQGRYSNPVPVLRSHLDYVARNFNVLLPGESLRPKKLNVCLIFDDAFVDFYAHVFPLLQEFSLRAVLAVPTAFIVESTGLSLEERLAVPEEEAMTGECYKTKVPLCTWEELNHMSGGGLVQIASHSHTHSDMTRPEVDAAFEAVQSRKLLESHINCHVSTFVYPFGKVNRLAHRVVKENYSFAMRLGTALNWNWTPWRQPLCRVQGDNTPNVSRLFQPDRLTVYGLKWVANGLRASTGKWEAS